MNVLFVASECSPIIKVGGLADVVGSLPKYLKKIGVNVAVALPCYRDVIENFQELLQNRLLYTEVRYGTVSESVIVFKTLIPDSNIPLYLFKNDKYLSDRGIYNSPTSFASDDAEINRFAFFSKAVSHVFLEEPGCDFKVDVFHCHDWHTGMIPRLTKSSAPSIFTIHNLANQGFSKMDIAEKLDLKITKGSSLEWDGEDSNLDFIMQGIISSDFVTTVSPQYAKEIQTTTFGEGLNEVISGKEGRVYGILNGIDYEVWNPATDNQIPVNFQSTNLQGKKECKKQLQNELNLPEDPNKPIVSYIARLTNQKGVDLLISLLDEILSLNCQVIILGTGDPSLENKLRIKVAELSQNGLFQIRPFVEFNENLAHKVYAGSDIFLVPSRFEPCGLTQMIAMRYGTIPVVRAVGGLFDTVKPGITGFTFENFDEIEFLNCLKRALNYFQYKNDWELLVQNALKEDFSWGSSAKKYFDIYKLALGQA